MQSEMRQRMKEILPNTLNALTWFVPAMEEAAKCHGKTSLFGKDKFAPAYQKVLEKLDETILAMELDGIIGFGATADEVNIDFFKVVTFFAQAYPNWPVAYRFFNEAFVEHKNRNLQALINTFVTSRQESPALRMLREFEKRQSE